MTAFAFKLGQYVRDKVTDFRGCVVGRAEHLSGCNTYGVQARAKGECDEITPAQWFDEPRLAVMAAPILVLDEREERTGADTIPASTRQVG